MIRSCTWINTVALAALVTSASGCQEKGAGAGGGSWGYSQPEPNAALQSFVSGTGLEKSVGDAQMRAPDRKRLVDQVRRLYTDQNYQLIWIDGEQPSDRYRQLTKVLDTADAHGLPRALYRTPLDGSDSGGTHPCHRPCSCRSPSIQMSW